MLVGNVIYGVSWAIIDDREHFEMLKYIYISPVQIYLYLMGRGFAKLATTIEAVIVTLAFGMVFLHVPLDPLKVDYPYLLVSFVVGLAGIVCLGVILAGISLITARHASVASESVAGIFYLLCGVIFPIDVLPTWVQPLAKVLPPTYWLEAIRRATLGSSISPAMQGFSNGEILLILVATTVVLAFFSNAFFRYVEYIAKKRGCIDQLTGY
jgi:ABC-2 type transport system permease protein